MADNEKQLLEDLSNYIRISNLPYEVTAKDITGLFGQFGAVIKLYLKRRVNKDSDVRLPNPSVTLAFKKSDIIDQIMAARPFYMGDCRLFVRRLLPYNLKYPFEPTLTVKKILVRTQSSDTNEILPDNTSIIEYLSAAGGKIDYFERLNDKTVLVQFDDYDPVDICCQCRPHYIKDQPIEIEKCTDEDLVRHGIEAQQKLDTVSNQFPTTSSAGDISDSQVMDTISSTPTLSAEDQITQLRSTYHNMTTRREQEHEQLIATLTAEWEQAAKERIRFQRLTLDCKQEHARLANENRTWQKLYSESLREKPNIQTEGEVKLSEAYQRNIIAKEKYDQLMQNIRQ